MCGHILSLPACWLVRMRDYRKSVRPSGNPAAPIRARWRKNVKSRRATVHHPSVRNVDSTGRHGIQYVRHPDDERRI